MSLKDANQSIAAATVSLLVCAACIISFIPPFTAWTTQSATLAMLVGMTLAVSLILHFVFVGISARRMGRSPWLWVGLSLCTFPITSIVGLVLIEWLGDKRNQLPDRAAG